MLFLNNWGKTMSRSLICILSAVVWSHCASAIVYPAPTDKNNVDPVVYYQNSFSDNALELFYEQHPGHGSWDTTDGVLRYSGNDSGLSALIAQPDANLNFLNRSIHCEVKVETAAQIAMVAIGFRMDALGNSYFLCAGIYEGRWAIGYYPRDADGHFSIIKSFDYPGYYTTWRKPELHTRYNLRLDIEQDTIRLFVNGYEIPYLHYQFDLLPNNGGLGFVVLNSANRSVHFDNYTITELVRPVGDLVPIPFVDYFSDASSFEKLRFTNPESWYIENGELVLRNPEPVASIAMYDQLLGNDWEIECDVTLGTADTRAGLLFNCRGMTGYQNFRLRAKPSDPSGSYIYWGRTGNDGNDIDRGVLESNPSLSLDRKYNLKVRCSAGSIEFYIDGRLWRSEPDLWTPDRVDGEFRFCVGLYNQSNSKQGWARFDNFKVTPLENAAWTPSDEDLRLDTPELSDDLDEKIVDRIYEQYEGSPERCYEYVANELHYQPLIYSEGDGIYYSGLPFDNAASALWRKSGTDVAQSAALMALLRKAGIHCRFVMGDITMDAVDWGKLFGQKLRYSDGSFIEDDTWVKNKRLIWLQAYIDDTVVDLFPWLKFYEQLTDYKYTLDDVLRKPTSEHPEWFGSWDAPDDEPISFEITRKCLNKHSDLFPRTPAGQYRYGTDQPIVILEKYIRDYLEEQSRGVTYDDIGAVERIEPQFVESLKEISYPAILKAVPDVLDAGLFGPSGTEGPVYRAKVQLRIDDDAGEGYYEHEFSVYELFNKRLTLTFQNPVAMEQVHGSHRAVPIVKLEGMPQGAWEGTMPRYGAGSAPHNYCTVKVRLYDAVNAVYRDQLTLWSEKLAVGSDIAIMLEMGAVTDGMYDYRLGKYQQIAKQLDGETFPQDPTDALYEPFYGNLLSLIGLRYFSGGSQSLLERLCGVQRKSDMQCGTSSRSIQAAAGFYYPGHLWMNIPFRAGSLVSIDPSKHYLPRGAERIEHQLSLLSGSAYEHGVYWDLFRSDDTGSAVKYLQDCTEQGGSILEVSKSYFDSNTAHVQDFITLSESDYGEVVGIYDDVIEFFQGSPSGVVWLPSKSVTNSSVRALGWLMLADAEENGEFLENAFSAGFIKIKPIPEH